MSWLEAGWVDPLWVGFGSLFLGFKWVGSNFLKLKWVGLGWVKFFFIKMGQVGLISKKSIMGRVGSISEKLSMGWVGLGQKISNDNGSGWVKKS